MKWILSLFSLVSLMAFSLPSTDLNNVCAAADIIVPSSVYADKSLELKVQDVSGFSFQLYDWKGNKVFQALVDVTYLPEEQTKDSQQKSIDMGWLDKTMQGHQMSSGNYIYIIEATCTADYHFRRKGNLTLIK